MIGTYYIEKIYGQYFNLKNFIQDYIQYSNLALLIAGAKPITSPI